MRPRTWLGLCTLVMLALLLSTAPFSVRADVTRVSVIAPGTFGEDDDYFTTVWGNPRDMDDGDDLHLINTSCGPLRTRFTDVSFADGVWRATTREGESGWVIVLNPGWASALRVGEHGALRPVDTGHYTQLTFRMRMASGAGTSAPQVVWANGLIAEAAPRGQRRFLVQGDGRWHVYSLNLGLDPNWTSGPVTWLWFELADLPPGHRIEIDWVRLTPRMNRQIRWEGSSLSGSAAVYLGPRASHPEQYGDLLLFEEGYVPLEISAGAKALSVPASLPAGEYYARVEVGGTGANSAQSWRFLPLPVAEIIAPSYTSGEDWATAVLGNPWDMEGLDDISVESTVMDAIRSMNTAGGVLTVVSEDDGLSRCDPPWPHRPLGLNLGGRSIDNAKYRYFSYRYRVDEAPEPGLGAVSRVRWQMRKDANWPTGRSDDIVLDNNEWHTFSLDLKTVQQEAEMGEWEDIPADVMQIMLHESHLVWTSQLDWVKLTAENTGTNSYTAQWNVLNTSAPVVSTLYWAQRVGSHYALVPGTERVIPLSASKVRPLSNGNHVFLPMIVHNFNPAATTQFRQVMSMAGLVRGQEYYLAIKLEDGYSVSWWYSSLPVRKQ